MIRLAAPTFPTGVLDEIRQVLDSGQLIQGRIVEEFEAAVGPHTGARNVIAVSSGTAALEVGLRSMGVGPGSRVIVPAYSFVASANAVVTVGAEPVFVDVREGDLTIDASRVAEAVDRQGVDVIMPVHEFGFPAQIDQIAMHSSLAGIPILEDAACALGTDSVPIIGTFGTLWCYSLHPRKVLTSGEGGLICTNDDSLAARLRLLRNHGLSWSDRGLDCVLPGTNARMTELQAVLALAQTQRLAAVVQRRREIAHRYSERLSVLSITLPPVDMIDSLNWQTYLVRFSSNEAREFAAERLRMAGIESSVGAQCIPAMSWYRARIGASEPSEAFPVSWNAWSRGLALPLHEGMSDDDVDRVIGVLQRVGVAA